MNQQDPRKWKIHRNKRGWPSWYQRWLEAFWILTGRWSLNRAWQDGLSYGTHIEYEVIKKLLTREKEKAVEAERAKILAAIQEQEEKQYDARTILQSIKGNLRFARLYANEGRV